LRFKSIEWGSHFMLQQNSLSLSRLRVVADADPAALTRVLNSFQNLNVMPRRVTAECGINDVLHIQVDVFGICGEQLALIAAKVRQSPCVVQAYWHGL
jgi:hypothetical protein